MTTTLEPTKTDSATDLFRKLEESFHEESECNLNHDLIGFACSVKVVARGVACSAEAMLCEVARIFCTAYMEAGLPCPWCDKKAADCWKITAA